MGRPREQVYDSIILAGGGAKGVGMLGALDYIHKNVMKLSNVHKWAGTSVGGIIGLLCLVGWTPCEIIEEISHSGVLKKIKQNEKIFVGKSIANIDIIIEFLEKLVSIKLGPGGELCTFKTLYDKTGKEFITNTVRVSRRDGEQSEVHEILSRKTTPNMNVIAGVAASSSLPGVFRPFYISPNCGSRGALSDNPAAYHVIDGGFGNNLLLELIKPPYAYTNALAIYMDLCDPIDVSKITILKYLYRCAFIPANIMFSEKIEKWKSRRDLSIIKLTTDLSSLQFSTPVPKLLDVYKDCYCQTLKQLANQIEKRKNGKHD